jgi:cytoskeletal protein RodZ
MSIFGETLRQARAHKGVTVKEAEQATRISRLYLSALEDEHFEALPPLIYQRGIVRNYATFLDLDPNKLLAMFEEARGGTVEPDVAPSAPPLNMPSHWAPNFAIIAFILVLGMIVFAWFYSAFLAPGDAPPTATSPVETVTPLPTDEAAQELIRSLVPTPTPTPVLTATPVADDVVPTSTPEPTTEPEPTAIDTVVVAGGESGGAASEQRVEERPVVEEPPVETGPAVSVVFTPSSDVYLTVIDANGWVIYDGLLAGGSTLGPFTSAYFEVYTSDAGATWITNMDVGVPFVMGSGEMTFTLSPL